ncbi:hypothetical protein NDU88_008731 [Pleurodeles waltl]|uniref:Uncharacterized protein n=1 Tax=Pleurodeles waltl TaxID=8319 RepID=A0AAV7PX05_PLEWA|nr:hypothetical protein NDU88_008731 [Pleurodeles waltl]
MHHFLEPIGSYPRGTQEQTIMQEMTSEEEFPRRETEIDVGRRVEEGEKPEGDWRTETGERGTPGVPRQP